MQTLLVKGVGDSVMISVESHVQLTVWIKATNTVFNKLQESESAPTRQW